MSTKIFNAFKFYGTVEELWPYLEDFRKVTWEATLNHLEACVDYTNPKTGIFDWAKVIDEAMKTPRRNAFNVSCSLVVYTNAQVAGILVQGFGFDTIAEPTIDDWLTANLAPLFPAGEFVDWHYQNQTDKPEAVSEAEWVQRDVDWLHVMKTSSQPSRAGLTVELIKEGDGIELMLDLQNRWVEWVTIQVACPVCGAPMEEIEGKKGPRDTRGNRVKHMECKTHGAPTRAMMVQGLGNKPMPPIDPMPGDEEEPQGLERLPT